MGSAIVSAPNIEVSVLADVFDDQVQKTRASLTQYGQEVPAKRCFVGCDAYWKVLETDVDYVILATPPHFRPEHFSALVEAGKHAFIEKPAGVDPVGIKTMFEAGPTEYKWGGVSVSEKMAIPGQPPGPPRPV